jgi:hypothetical protein
MNKFEKLEKRLAKKSGKSTRVIPWGNNIVGDKMDIQVGEHTGGEVDSFQVLTNVPTDKKGWAEIEARVLRMAAANVKLVDNAGWAPENEE